MNSSTWHHVTVTIQTTLPERSAQVMALLEQVGTACPGAIVLIVPHVPDAPERAEFHRVLVAASTIGRPWILHLEEDMVLAPTFGTDALAAGVSNDIDAVNLFSCAREDVVAFERGQRLRKIDPADFGSAKGFFIRSEMVPDLPLFAFDWYRQNRDHQGATGQLLAAYLASKRARVRVRVPSLVQRRVERRPGLRRTEQSETFRMAFGDVA